MTPSVSLQRRVLMATETMSPFSTCVFLDTELSELKANRRVCDFSATTMAPFLALGLAEASCHNMTNRVNSVFSTAFSHFTVSRFLCRDEPKSVKQTSKVSLLSLVLEGEEN